MVQQVEKGGTQVAKYVARSFQPGIGQDYMWDELAAAGWIDATLITKSEVLYMGVDTDRGASYGNTLTWSEKSKPQSDVRQVEVQLDLDREKFYRMFVELMSAATPTRPSTVH